MSRRTAISLVALATALAAAMRAETPATTSAPVVTEAAAAAPALAVPLTRDTLLTQLRDSLVSHYNLEGQLDLEFLREWTAPSTLATRWSIELTTFPNVPASSMLLRCRVLADGKAVMEPTLVVRAALWRDVWAAREPLTYGSTFDPSMLEARRVDLFRERDALPAAVGDRSYIFSRSVSAGQLLTWRDITRRPLVKKGELVDVTAVEGALIVTMKAVAMENGAQGDTVTVRNPESRKDFAAMVVDENRVQVRF